MKRSIAALAGAGLLVTVAAVGVLGAREQQPDARTRVRTLVDAGKLEEAEEVARGAGPALTALLGEVLVARGRLSAADSVLRLALERDPAGRRSAEAALAELAFRRGDRAEALRRAGALAAAYEQGSRWSADDRVAAGRAYVLLGTRTSAAVRQALSAFDEAASADPSNIDARLRAGNLLLDKYNAPDAKESFDEVLKLVPDHPRAVLGLARIADFEGKGEAMALTRRSLAKNPSLVEAQQLLARFHLEAEAYDSARAAARRALAVDSSSTMAWAVLGATGWLTGDSAEFRQARAAAQRLNPRPSDFYVEIAEAAVRQRRYAQGVSLAQQALALDSSSTRALGFLGTNQLRAGNIEAGRANLERAFAIDPFNLWHKNTLDLLDQLKTFTTIDRGRFRIVAPPKEAELLAIYLVPLLEEAFDTLASRYKYRPPTPVRMELYRQHADFSVRTVGLAGLGALGVSFGPVLAMDAPSARARGEFNWGSTAWHELAHTFTLGMSGNRAPRWLSEGLSVLEERRARPGWGAGPSPEFLAAYLGGRIRPVSQLNEGFVRPRSPREVLLSYYTASLVCEMIEAERGTAALVGMLTAYRDGLDTPGVFAKVLGQKPEELDRKFDTWVRAKFATPLRAMLPDTSGGGEARGAFISAMAAGVGYLGQKQTDSARAVLQRAQALFPEYGGGGSPAQYLAQLAVERNDLREALAQVTQVTTKNETAWEANLLEASLRERLGDSASARVPLERLLWISPYDVGVHVRLAELASRRGDHATAVRERRAILALDPPDPLDARYQLASALAAGGDVAGARRELLAVLEQAPSFEKAQTLLLELRNRGGAGTAP